MKKKAIIAFLVAGTVALILTACSSGGSSNKTYTIGVASDQEKTEWTQVAKDVKSKGITLKIKEFTDYTQENPALADGSLDLNAFQTKAYLDNWNKENKGNLVSIGYTYISPLGLYSDKIKNPDQIKDGDTIAVPNDPTNETRALQLLQALGVIEIQGEADPANTQVKDIKTYHKKVEIKALDASQVAASLPDVTAAVINTNFVQDQLKKTPKDAIYRDTDQGDKVADVYKNLVAVTKDKENEGDLKTIVKAYQSEAVAKIIEQGGDATAWE